MIDTRSAQRCLLFHPNLLNTFSDFQKIYDEKALDRFWADIIIAGLSHPFPVWCVSEILKWVESGEYQAVMKIPERAAA